MSNARLSVRTEREGWARIEVSRPLPLRTVGAVRRAGSDGGEITAIGVSRSRTVTENPRCTLRKYSDKWAFNSEILTRPVTPI